MLVAFPDDPTKTVSGTFPRRLDGWKAISSYLGKSERTVKRWEIDRGLPIHRVPGGGRAAVYAVAAELNAWLTSSATSEVVASLSKWHDGSILASEDEILPSEEPVSSGSSLKIVTNPDVSVRWKHGIRWVAAGSLIIGLAVTSFLSAGVASKTLSLLNPLDGLSHGPRSIGVTTVSAADKALALDLYYQGRFEWNKRSPESLNKALDDFTRSIAHDPTAAHTFAGLADTYLLLHEYTSMPPKESYDRAIVAAQKAVQLDGSIAEPHRSLAFAEAWGQWDFDSAEKEFQLAIKLDPRDPLTHLWFATAFESPAWKTSTLREFDRAQELDPTSSVILANKSIWLFEMGQKQEGLEMAERLEQADPNFVAPHRFLAQMFWNLRDYPKFLDESDKLANLTHNQYLRDTTAAARSGFRRNSELGLLKSLYAARKNLYTNGKIAGVILAECSLRLGKREEALQLIEDDFVHRRAEFLAVLTDPDLMTLQSDSRYQELVKRLHIPASPT
jgi:tetratricopeptide (TPR) repeat protein